MGGTMIRIVRRPAMRRYCCGVSRGLCCGCLRGPSERPASDFIAHIAARSRRLARRRAAMQQRELDDGCRHAGFLLGTNLALTHYFRSPSGEPRQRGAEAPLC